MKSGKEYWDIEITPKNNYFSLNLKEVWKYRDLLKMYIHRDIVTMYKQTLLGPIWYIIQPLFQTLMYAFVFGNVAKISTDGLPQILFYLSGVMAWNYFSECLGRASGTFLGNAGVFSKVYFPRLVVPLSGLISSLVKVLIQFLLFAGVYIYYFYNGADIHLTKEVIFLPFLFIMLAGLGFGFGVLISSMTTKYRDLAFLFGFLTQLWMYATPVIYPLSSMPEKYMWLIKLNPLTSILEALRYSLTGSGFFDLGLLLYSLIFTITISIIGIWMFNKVERSFIDVI